MPSSPSLNSNAKLRSYCCPAFQTSLDPHRTFQRVLRISGRFALPKLNQRIRAEDQNTVFKFVTGFRHRQSGRCLLPEVERVPWQAILLPDPKQKARKAAKTGLSLRSRPIWLGASCKRARALRTKGKPRRPKKQNNEDQGRWIP